MKEKKITPVSPLVQALFLFLHETLLLSQLYKVKRKKPKLQTKNSLAYALC